MREIEFIQNENNNGRQIREILKEFGVSSTLLTKLMQTENGITKTEKLQEQLIPSTQVIF